MSAEPSRRQPYSNDLRWRIVYQRLGMNLTFSKIAANLNIAQSTACRIFSRFKITGSVSATATPKRKQYLRVLDERGEMFVIGLILDKPSLYLEEICHHVHDVLGVTISTPSICRLLSSYGFTRKRIRREAIQRSDTLRGAFMAHMLMFTSDKYVFIDECGSDARDHIRNFGYALRGCRPTVRRMMSRGKRVNAIAAISNDGVLAVEYTTSTVDQEVFFDFVRSTLIPNMMPFDGINSRSIAVMDNLSVHHVRVIVELFTNANILVQFLPPYSPDLNPIEETFSYIKSYLKKHEAILQCVPNPINIISAAFDSITALQCQSWISHSGYE